jgi:hypothetical protein
MNRLGMQHALTLTPKRIHQIHNSVVLNRTMSSKLQFLAIVHDFPGMMQKRIEVRQTHLSLVCQNQVVRAGGKALPESG